MLTEQAHSFLLPMAIGLYFGTIVCYLRSFFTKGLKIDTLGNSLLILGILCHTLDLGLHLAASDQYSLYNRLVMVSFMMIFVSVGYLLIQQKFKLKHLGIFYVLPSFMLFVGAVTHQFSTGIHLKQLIVDGGNLGIGGNLGYLHWIRNVHSVLSVLAISFFNLSFVNSILYLMMESRLKKKMWDFWFERLPSINTLEEMGHQSTLLGFLCLTLSILSGAIYHHRMGQTFLNIGPREWMIFIAWFAYLIYFHIRFSFGALGKRLAYIAIACYLLQIFAIFSMIGIHRF